MQGMQGRSFVKLPEKLPNHIGGMIDIGNTDNECFVSCHIRHLNAVSKSTNITQPDKEFVE